MHDDEDIGDGYHNGENQNDETYDNVLQAFFSESLFVTTPNLSNVKDIISTLVLLTT